jgi:hypothetical protein
MLNSNAKSDQEPVICETVLNCFFLHEREWDVTKAEDRGQRTDDGPDMETTRDNNSGQEKQVNYILVKSNEKSLRRSR